MFILFCALLVIFVIIFDFLVQRCLINTVSYDEKVKLTRMMGILQKHAQIPLTEMIKKYERYPSMPYTPFLISILL